MQFFKNIKIKTNGQQLIDVTPKIIDFVEGSLINKGILNLSILHTSASLIVQENADPDVQKDLLNFLTILLRWKPIYIFTKVKEKMICHHISKLR